MRKTRIAGRDSFRGIILCGVVLAASFLFTLPAIAANALFSGTIQRFHYGYLQTFAVVPSATAASGMVGTGPNPSFTVPSKAFAGGTFSYTAAFPGYPFFKAYRTRFMTGGNFAQNHLVPGTSFTLGRANTVGATQYPNALPTSPTQGVISVKAGPNGFGGFWGLYDDGRITGTLESQGGGGGYSDFRFKPLPHGAVPGLAKGNWQDGGKNNWPSLASSNNPTKCCQYSVITNQTNPSQMGGLVGARIEGVGHLTGTIVVSVPSGNYATKVTYIGADARTAAGLNGTISLVAPGLVHNYVTDGVPAVGTGTTGITSLNTGAPDTIQTTLTFLPEPSQFALLGAGMLGLLGLARHRSI